MTYVHNVCCRSTAPSRRPRHSSAFDSTSLTAPCRLTAPPSYWSGACRPMSAAVARAAMWRKCCCSHGGDLLLINVCMMCVCFVCFVCYYLNKPTFTFQTASDAQDINEAGLNSQHLQTLLYIEAKDANNCADRSRRVLCPNISICFKWTLNHL